MYIVFDKVGSKIINIYKLQRIIVTGVLKVLNLFLVVIDILVFYIILC